MKLLLTFVLMTASALAHSGHHLYVVNKSADSISVVDADRHQTEHTVPVGRNPHELAVSPDGSKLYVANAGGNSVSVVDLTTFTERRKITSPDFAFPHGVAFTPDGRYALVTSEQSRKIFLVDAATDEIVRAIDTDQGGTHMATVDSGGEWAYFTNRESNTVSVMDLRDFSIAANIPVGDGAEGFALSPDEAEVWVSDRNAASISVIDVGARRVAATIPVGERPNRVTFTPDGRHVLVPMGSGEVHVFGRVTREVERIIPSLGSGAGGIVPSPDGRWVFVAVGGSDAIHVVDAGDWTVTGRIRVGSGPDGIALK